MRRGRVIGGSPTLPGTRRPTRRLAYRLRARGDDGFVLLETIVSISLITVVMAALTSLFVTVIRVDSEQRARQVAVQVADSTASYVRSLPPSDLLTGRTVAAVAAQWLGAPADVKPYLTSMEQALPLSSGGTVVLPMALPPQVVHGISYTVNVYLGWCHTATTESPACVTPATVHDQLRAVFGVTWPDKHCALSTGIPTCVYTSATLLSTAIDPVFALNQPAAPAPVITLPSWTTYAVGDTVALQMTATGVPQFTWAPISGTWPGATLNPDGSVTGTLTTPGPTTLTVEVTDSFGRKTQGTFTWTVLSRLVATGPAARNDTLGTPIPTVTLGITGGAGPPYTWSINPTGPLPPGLTLNTATGAVTGTPTAVASAYPATYAVQLTVTDKTTTRKATVAFPWTIRNAPLTLGAVTTQADSVGQSVDYQPTATGGASPYVWSITPLPAGLSVSTDGLGHITGIPISPGTTTVGITVTDRLGVQVGTTFIWTVVTAPSVTSPRNLSSRVGSPVKIRLATTCPAGGCSYALVNGPPGVTVDTTGLMTGTVGGSAGNYPAVTVTVTDANGATASSAAFSWTVAAGNGNIGATWPVFTSPGQAEQPFTITCPKNSCTVSVTGQPSGIGLTSNENDFATNHPSTFSSIPIGTYTGYLSGTVSGSARSYPVTLTISWPGGSATDSGTWTVRSLPTITSPGNLQSRVGSPVGVRPASTCSAPCSYTLANAPPGVSIDGTGLMTGPVGGSAGTYTGVTVTVADAGGATASVAFSWTVGAATTGAGFISATWPVLTSPGAPAEQLLTWKCPTNPCTVSVTGQPSGVSLTGTQGNFTGSHQDSWSVSNGTFTTYLSGTVSGTAPRRSYPVTLTITWSGGSDSHSGTWTVQ